MKREKTTTTVNIDEDEAPPSCYARSWAAGITEEYAKYVPSGDGVTAGSSKCIFKWPHELQKLLGDQEGTHHREPHMVAIGPYHHGRPHLQPMERYKKDALFRVLRLSGGLAVSNFLEPLKEVEQQLRDHYDDLDPWWSSGPFIQMMLLDGCFLLDFLLELDQHVGAPMAQSIRQQLLNTYSHAVFLRDIHLLENQIPGLVLDLLINVGDWGGIFTKPENGKQLSFEALHLLDLQRKSMLYGKSSAKCDPAPKQPRLHGRLFNLLGVGGSTQSNAILPSGLRHEKQSGNIIDLALRLLPKREKYVRSATKLRAAGISFKKCAENTGMNGVRFSRSLRGVLYLPELILDETTEGVLMNMVVFERMHPQSGTGITSFISFMDALIDTAEDVSFLGDQGIVKNSLGSDEAAAKIFNKLGIHGMCKPFNEVLEQVQKYASEDVYKWYMQFKLTHFQSPWTVISLVGALFLIIVTLVQTIYTILQHYQKSK